MFNFDPIGGEMSFEEKGGGLVKGLIHDTTGINADKVKDNWKDAKGAKGHLKALGGKNGENITKVTNAADKGTIKMQNMTDNRSIIARARNSVLQFPVYASNTLRVNEAHLISESFARVYTSFVQEVLSQNQFISEEEANNLLFLKNFHTNIKESVEEIINPFYQPIDDFDAIMQESVYFERRISENCTVTFKSLPRSNKIINMESVRLAHDPMEGFTRFFEAREETVQKKGITLSEDDFADLAMNKLKYSNKQKEIYNTPDDKLTVAADKTNKANYQKEVGDKIKEIKDDIKKGKIDTYGYKNGRYYRVEDTLTTKKIDKTNDPVDTPHILKDTDIKKINAGQPYHIEATFRVSRSNGSNTDVKYIIGVKCILHLIRPQDLADDLQELVTGKIKSLQKVRYKSGEIGFLDYVFNLKGLKADAAKHVNYNKRWINTLKRLSEYRKAHGGFLQKPIENMTDGKVPLPNGTLVLTQADITTLINQTGIDLSDAGNATKLAKNLFLIAVVIVDGSAGTMRVLRPDESSSWSVESLASIDAELSKADNSSLMKELNKMVNR